MKKIWVTLMLVLFSTGAMAEWTKLGEDENGDATDYVEIDKITRKGDTTKMWAMLDYKAGQALTEGEFFLSLKTLTEYHCKEAQYRVAAFGGFGGNMGTGKRLFSTDSTQEKWKKIIPGSQIDKKWKIACGKQ